MIFWRKKRSYRAYHYHLQSMAHFKDEFGTDHFDSDTIKSQLSKTISASAPSLLFALDHHSSVIVHTSKEVEHNGYLQPGDESETPIYSSHLKEQKCVKEDEEVDFHDTASLNSVSELSLLGLDETKAWTIEKSHTPSMYLDRPHHHDYYEVNKSGIGSYDKDSRYEEYQMHTAFKPLIGVSNLDQFSSGSSGDYLDYGRSKESSELINASSVLHSEYHDSPDFELPIASTDGYIDYQSQDGSVAGLLMKNESPVSNIEISDDTDSDTASSLSLSCSSLPTSSFQDSAVVFEFETSTMSKKIDDDDELDNAQEVMQAPTLTSAEDSPVATSDDELKARTLANSPTEKSQVVPIAFDFGVSHTEAPAEDDYVMTEPAETVKSEMDQPDPSDYVESAEKSTVHVLSSEPVVTIGSEREYEDYVDTTDDFAVTNVIYSEGQQNSLDAGHTSDYIMTMLDKPVVIDSKGSQGCLNEYIHVPNNIHISTSPTDSSEMSDTGYIDTGALTNNDDLVDFSTNLEDLCTLDEDYSSQYPSQPEPTYLDPETFLN